MFCRIVRARSYQNRRALELLHKEGLFGQVIAIFRQELDSLIRVIYLLSISDMTYRDRLIRATIEGRRWTDEKGRTITDFRMVQLAEKLHGWDKLVYRFGCAFIHLSNLHDYQERDPLSLISSDEKEAILDYIRRYHGGPTQSDPEFNELVPFLPKVFYKIADNLESYIKDLESNKTLQLQIP
jgi:hypothetical protein